MTTEATRDPMKKLPLIHSHNKKELLVFCKQFSFFVYSVNKPDYLPRQDYRQERIEYVS